ncbi:hypothetical protein Glove_456g40 [Diversispora epigaea]|uniref:Uncharacterized protein n=1 Tax=Diversispora epigaea TaxID=1348612 RepID=A0A397GUY3_9GLOM|nr:hypothetical protein Glove_456g40 [Diversispora epigaea]
MGKKKIPPVIIWDEVCTVPKHILEMFINYLLEHKYQVICCGDDAQPPPFFGEMPHKWLKKHADYYEEVITDYQAKCPILYKLKKIMRYRILSAHRLSRRIVSQKCLELHRTKYPNTPIPLIYRSRDGPQTWHSFFRWNGVGNWTPERMGKKKIPPVIIWDEVCTVPKHILEMFINYLLEHKYQVICCGDDAQPPPFFGEMPHKWLKKHADYYEEVITDYQAKCPILYKLKKIMRILSTIEKWEYLEKKWTPSDRILSAHRLSRRIVSQKCLELHRTKYPNTPIPLIYRSRDGRKQNCLVLILGLSEKQELVKNNIVYLSLNILSETFIADILKEEKILDWDLGYAMTVHTKGPPLPPEIVEARNKKTIEQSLRPFISEKLVRYMNQDKKKDREFNLSDEAGDLDQWTVDRINNNLGHIEGNVRLTCLECNKNYQT